MKPLYSIQEFNSAKSKDKLLLECYTCQNSFNVLKSRIVDALNPKCNFTAKYCSRQCVPSSRQNLKPINVLCCNCDKTFKKYPSQIKKSPNHFCSKSCAASYNNKHKSKGTRRSKLETYIENQLTQLYPNLHIDYNKKSAIGSELDIYIPSLNIAFELNGIFHYEPIYGVDKLQTIQKNDQNKFKTCYDNKIDLCIIDTSNQKYFKESTSQKYLDIITNIINQRT